MRRRLRNELGLNQHPAMNAIPSLCNRCVKNLRSISILLVLALASAGAAFSQAVTATLVGTVTDVSGGVIAGAKVTILETNTGISHSSQTNESGNYTFPDLAPGLYRVSVEMQGFQKEVRGGVEVVVNSTTRVDTRLQPGSVSETVEVTGAPPILQTDRADTGRFITTVQVQALPLGVNRNFQGLLDLVPGTTEASFQNSPLFNAASTLQTEVNGQMRQGNSFQIEGVDDNQFTRNVQVLVPPAEAIETVNTSTSNHDSELGTSSGAVTNVILKSGTNAYHGSVYEFLRNSAMDSRSFFNPTVGHIAYNYLGGSLGGPIRKNRIFFFGDYLRSMDREANTNLATIPSIPFRSGDLSASSTTIYNPFSGNSDGTGRTPFTGNQIPASLINPVSAKILALLPAPNQPFKESAPSNDYYGLLPAQKTTNSFDAKIDADLTSKDRLSGRLSFARTVVYQAPMFGDAGGPAQSAYEATGLQRTYSGGLNYVKTVLPTLLTELRFGVSYNSNVAQQSDYGKNDSAAIGIPGVNLGVFSSGMVGITINNFSSPLVGYNAGLPWVRGDANGDLVNTWTKISGNHTIKFGVDLRRQRLNVLQCDTYSARGLYSFAENQTSLAGKTVGFGNDFASFLLDQPNSLGRDFKSYFPASRAWYFSAFVSDRWQVSSKLTVNLGLRWELYPPPTPAYPGGFSNYDFVNNKLVIAGVGGNPMNLGMQTRYRYFAPRTGIAYRFTGSTVIRTGFGISYTTPCVGNGCQPFNYPVAGNNIYQPAGNSPYTPALLPDGQVATFQVGPPPPASIVIPSSGVIANPDPTSTWIVQPVGLKSPHVEAWNLAVQQALPLHFTVDAAYVGSHGVDTLTEPNINAGLVIGAGSKGQPQYPRTASTNLYWQGLSSTYQALQMKFDRRFTSGLMLTTAFTYGKALAFQTGDNGGLLFYIDQQRNYARADFDRTFSFVQSYVYQLPFGKGQKWLSSGPGAAVLGGWHVSGILTARSGLPMTLTANSAGLNAPSNTQTPNQVAPIQILHGINVGNPWFATSSFVQPAGAVLGNMGRNIMSGPGYFRLNLSLSKRVQLNERFSLDLRGEALNFTNTPQFSNPGVSLTSATFGIVNSTVSSGSGVNGTGGGRAIQLSARVAF